MLAKMKLFLPRSVLASGYGAVSRHQLPRSTVAGGQVPASCSAVLPPTWLALRTVGIAAAAGCVVALAWAPLVIIGLSAAALFFAVDQGLLRPFDLATVGDPRSRGIE